MQLKAQYNLNKKTQETKMKINSRKKIKKKYIITSITNPAGVSRNFLRALERAAGNLKADIEIYPTKKFKKNECIGDEKVEQYLVNRDRRFNKNLKVLNSLNVNENTVDPTTGLHNEGESLIIPHPSHRLRTVARQVKISPHPSLITATGSLNLRDDEYNSKTQYKGNSVHVTGALYIEVYEGGKFSLTQITWDGKGFQILDRYYTAKSSSSVAVEAIVLGDIHPGEHCEHNLKECYTLISKLRPKSLILHDWLNGDSISHHTAHKPILRSLHQQSLASEVETAAKLIGQIRDRVKGTKIHLVSSNHPEHIEQYLEDGRFLQDTQNLKLAAGCLKELVNGRCLYEFLFKKHIKLKNINILSRDCTLNIAGYELSNHGDHGANGSRSCKNVISKREIVGHAHSPEITKRGGIVVGTSTKLNLGYTNSSGFSSWANAHSIVYKNGTSALVFIIK